MAAEAFFIASVLVSFLAGIVALAMPCCFSVLLPSYLASTFKKRARILGMTFVFSLGVAAVLLPIALGVYALSSFISLNHSLLFVLGGFFMVFLGVASLFGIQLIPMFSPDVKLEKSGVPTVFTLGVFGGVASSCCAPVLAGIMVLTALTSSLMGAVVVGVSYVAGMVFPLFVAGILMDRNSTVQRFLQGRMVHTKMGDIHSSKLLAGGIFLLMGAVTIVLGLMDKMLPTPGSDFFNIYETVIQDAVEGFISSPVALVVLGAVLISTGYYFRKHVLRARGARPGRQAPA